MKYSTTKTFFLLFLTLVGVSHAASDRWKLVKLGMAEAAALGAGDFETSSDTKMRRYPSTEGE